MTARPSDCITVGREDAVSPDRTGQKVLTSESKLAAQSCTQWRHTQAEPFHKPVGSLSSPLQQQILPPPAVTQYTAFVVIPNSMLPGLGLSTPSRYLARLLAGTPVHYYYYYYDYVSSPGCTEKTSVVLPVACNLLCSSAVSMNSLTLEFAYIS